MDKKLLKKWFKIHGDSTLRIEYELKNDSIVFDLGGYKGDWSQKIHDKYHCQIYIFEPLNEYYGIIKNRMEGFHNIKLYNFALGSANEEKEICINNDSTSLYNIVPGNRTEKIKIKNIIEFIEKNNIHAIDLIKINIEGAEYDLLEYIIEQKYISKFKNIQVQFHEFIENAELRMTKIQNYLKDTHSLSYQFKFIWENWRSNDLPRKNIYKIPESTLKTFLIRIGIGKIYSICKPKIDNIYKYYYWILKGKRNLPPQKFKQHIILYFSKKYKIMTFIETGTFFGDTVNAVKRCFNNIYTIELDKNLHQKAEKRFVKYKHIHCMPGDSSYVLPELMKKIEEPCLFWLDGHYSEGITAKGEKETPIIEELNAILNHKIKNHVILIDDARCFNGTRDYPTIDEIHKIISSNKNYRFEVMYDIIRIQPK